MLTLFARSDATRETAERMVRAALAQFETGKTSVLRRGQVRTRGLARPALNEASASEATILHTLVSDELRDLMPTQARPHSVDSMDLLSCCRWRSE